MKWLKKKMIFKKENDLKRDNSTKALDHTTSTMQMVMDRIKYQEERAKSYQKIK